MSATPQQPAPEALLAQQDFVRALVRTLLRGADGEDDILQRTWLQALQRPPRDAGRGRQWLARVARNLTRDHLRSARRRDARERRAARPPAVPSTADVVQREAERQRVVEALLGLAEPYRSTVLMRFWEDLTPATIAARLGVPGATVRARLQRGLAMLRQKLDHDYGDRRAWLVALTPCATLAEPAVATPLLGALIMSLPMKIAFATGGLVLAALALWSFGLPAGAPVAERVEHGPPNPITAAASRSEEHTDAAATTTPARVAAAADPDFVLRGEVRCNGEPFAGLALTARWFEGTTTDGEPTVEVALRSDANGNFAWHQPRPAGTTTIRFTTTDPRRKIFAAPVVVFAGAERADCVIDVVRLDCTLRGRIRNNEGAPIAGATVNLNSWHDATSDADGRYEINVTTGDDSLPLIAYADGYVEQLLQTNIEPTATTHTMDITLQPGMTIAGRVVDAAGVPVAGAVVGASGASQRPTTDADGRFAFRSISPESRHGITARKRGFAPTEVIAEPGEDDLELVLRPGVALAGTVCDTSGQPIAGASIGLFLTPYSALRHGAYTALDGSFRVEDLEPGTEIEVRAQKAGYAAVSRPVKLDDPVTEIDVRLEPGRNLRGRVVDEGGAPIAGASVYAERAGDESMRRSIGQRCDTDADGRFEVRDLPTEACHVYAFKAGYVRGSEKNVFGGGPELSIRLQRAPAVAGRVIDGATRAPIEAFTVRIAEARTQLGQPWGRAIPFRDSGGCWRSKDNGYAVGQKLYIEVAAEGYAPARAEVVATYDPVADAQVTALFAGVTLRGSVRGAADRRPLAGARIQPVLAGDDVDLAEFAERGTTSGDDGSFVLPSVPAGAVRLLVTHTDHARTVHGPIDVATGPGTQSVEILLGVGASVRGRLVGFARRELQVSCNSTEHPEIRRAEVTADGSFEFLHLNAGTYVASIRTAPDDARGVLVEVGTGDVVEIEIRARDGNRRLEVTIPGAGKGDARLRPLDAPAPGPPPTMRWIGFDAGSFSVDGLAATRYELRIEVDAGIVTRTVDLARQPTARLTVEMR